MDLLDRPKECPRQSTLRSVYWFGNERHNIRLVANYVDWEPPYDPMVGRGSRVRWICYLLLDHGSHPLLYQRKLPAADPWNTLVHPLLTDMESGIFPHL